MNFTLGYIKSDKQFHLKTFSSTGDDFGKIMELEELKDTPLSGLIYDQDNLDEGLSQILSDSPKFFPVRSNSDLSLSYEDFTSLDFKTSSRIPAKVSILSLTNCHFSSV